MTRSDEEAGLSSAEQFEELQGVKGRSIAYRKRDAGPDDATTFLIRPRQSKIDGYDVITWMIADQLTARIKTRYLQHLDDTTEEIDAADEIRATRFIAVPLLGALAIDDRAGDRYLGARSAAGRFKSLMAQVCHVDASIIFAGTAHDVDKALSTWALDHFSFTVRPANPHPPKLGEKLEELLKPDQVGRFRGVAMPFNNAKMTVSDSGLIAEAKGLSDAGYGQYGASGVTPNGLSASLSSPKFDMVKENNIRRQAENRVLKIHVEQADSLEAETKQVVKALADMYSG